MSEQMTAMQVVELGQPMVAQRIDRPEPGAGEVLVQVHACGVNFGDLLIVDGKYQEKRAVPFTPGMEVAATVRSVGSGVTSLEVGQRIGAYCGFGGFAEFAAIPADICVPVPDSMPDADVAAFLIAYGTSDVALRYRAGLQPGETLLVLGASGGVGLTAVELGKQMDAKVIACARGEDKLQVCKEAGADHLINSETDDIREVVKSLGGADVVYDPVGGDQFKAALRACNPDARILPLGFASGEVPQIPANIILVKNVSVLGFYWGGYSKTNPQVLTDSFDHLFRLYAAGELRPHVSHRVPLERANEALDLLRQRKATGKVVVTV